MNAPTSKYLQEYDSFSNLYKTPLKIFTPKIAKIARQEVAIINKLNMPGSAFIKD